MANNFKPWVDSPTAGQQVQSASVFATDTQRVDGFKAGDPASALRVNSALRQANIVVAGLMQMCDDIKTLPDGLSLMSTVTQVKNAIKAAIDQLDATVLASAKSYTDTREGVINGEITNIQTQVTSNKNSLNALEPRVDNLEDEVAALSGYVQGNPTENGTVDLAKLKVGDTVYNVPRGKSFQNIGTFSIAPSEWTALSNATPYTVEATKTVTLQATVEEDSPIMISFDDVIASAGVVLASATGTTTLTLVFYAASTPSNSITGTIGGTI